MNPKSLEARQRDDNPFEGLNISDSEILNTTEGRSPCSQCSKSRKYFCYTCFVPVSELQNYIPRCKLPIKVDIIKHRGEIDGKSTAAHAAVLAPQDVTIYTYPEIPKYNCDGRTVLLYPGTHSCSIQDLFKKKQNTKSYSDVMKAALPVGFNIGTLRTRLVSNDNVIDEIFHVETLPIDRLVIIDSTWNQSRGIYADEKLQALPTVVLQNRISQFWRYQKGSPRWYLSTIEALHQFLLELHVCSWGCSGQYKTLLTEHYPIHNPDENHPQCKPYNGDYDDLLYLFKFMYEKLHKLYKHEDLLAYKRPMK